MKHQKQTIKDPAKTHRDFTEIIILKPKIDHQFNPENNLQDSSQWTNKEHYCKDKEIIETRENIIVESENLEIQ